MTLATDGGRLGLLSGCPHRAWRPQRACPPRLSISQPGLCFTCPERTLPAALVLRSAPAPCPQPGFPRSTPGSSGSPGLRVSLHPSRHPTAPGRAVQGGLQDTAVPLRATRQGVGPPGKPSPSTCREPGCRAWETSCLEATPSPFLHGPAAPSSVLAVPASGRFRLRPAERQESGTGDRDPENLSDRETPRWTSPWMLASTHHTAASRAHLGEGGLWSARWPQRKNGSF